MTRRRPLIALVVVLLPLAAHAIWDQLEATWFGREFSALADRHEPVSSDFLRFPLATQEQRRAARIYAAAANLARNKRIDDPRLSSLEIDIERAFLEPDPAAALEPRWKEYVEHEPALDLLDQASPLDFAGFGPAAPELNENASPLVELASISAMRIATYVARGDAPAAARALIASIRLQRTFPHEFYLMSPSADLLGSLRLLLRYAPPEEATLADVQRAFEATSDEDSLVSQLRTRRARSLGANWPYLPHSDAWALRVRTPQLRGLREQLMFFVLRPLWTSTLRGEIAPFDAAIDVARRPWPEKIDALRELSDRYGVHPQDPVRRQWCCYLTFAPAMWGIRELQTSLPLAGEHLAIRRVAIATLAAERYRRMHGGRPPGSLQALVPEYLAQTPTDPFTGTPLVYRVETDGYLVYSVARDRNDDGGQFYGFGSGAAALSRTLTNRDKRDVGVRVAFRSGH